MRRSFLTDETKVPGSREGMFLESGQAPRLCREPSHSGLGGLTPAGYWMCIRAHQEILQEQPQMWVTNKVDL